MFVKQKKKKEKGSIWFRDAQRQKSSYEIPCPLCGHTEKQIEQHFS